MELLRAASIKPLVAIASADCHSLRSLVTIAKRTLALFLDKSHSVSSRDLAKDQAGFVRYRFGLTSALYRQPSDRQHAWPGR
jgi:hypothetical protein